MNLPNRIIIIFFSAITFLSSCEVSVTTAHVENVKTCTDLVEQLCTSNISIFNPTDPVIYASCNLNNAPDNTNVTFVWKYTGGDNPVIIDEVTLNSSGKGTNLDLHSSLSKPYNNWPVGGYEVNIIIESDYTKPVVKYFEIR